MNIIETIHLPDHNGFNLRLNVLEESIPLDNDYEQGDLMYFCAQVVASKCGVDLSSDYLGTCLYADPQDFINNSGYIDDMIEAATTEAAQKITELLLDQKVLRFTATGCQVSRFTG